MLIESQIEPRTTFGVPRTDLTMMLVILIWGANFSMVKISLLQMSPLTFATLRFIIATPILWIFMRWSEGAVPLPPRSLWKLIWIGVIGNTAYQVFFAYGLSISTAANGALLIATVPAMIALGGALLGIEQLTRQVGLGIVLAFIGVVPVVAVRGLAFSFDTLLGDLCMLGSAVCWTIYTLGVRTIGSNISPLRITAMTMITGLPGLILIGTPAMLQTDWSAISLEAWSGLGYASVLGLVVAYAFWNNSVRLVGGNRTALWLRDSSCRRHHRRAAAWRTTRPDARYWCDLDHRRRSANPPLIRNPRSAGRRG
ncbi:MAG: DMT family transporter [Chloroflexales bacterium]|nr:DMT family transporter [Chloroflexales bacterium]